jgi:hypothetical protein
MSALEKVARGLLATLPALGVVATIVSGTASATFLGGAQPAPADPRMGAIVATGEQRIDSVTLLPVDLRARIAPALLQAPGGKLARKSDRSDAVSDRELDQACGAWFVTWDQDTAGNPIADSAKLHCGGSPIPIG